MRDNDSARPAVHSLEAGRCSLNSGMTGGPRTTPSSSLFSVAYEVVAHDDRRDVWDVFDTIRIDGPEARSDALYALHERRREYPHKTWKIRWARTERRFLDD